MLEENGVCWRVCVKEDYTPAPHEGIQDDFARNCVSRFSRRLSNCA